ncbi:MAG: glycosyltransferase [Clostridia bacterium]|nr:glycosyltransferase [Clostridia bacterium]
MRLVVNNIAASSGGAMTVLKDFYYSVCENDKQNEWIFLLSDKYFEETENVKIISLPEIKKSVFKKLCFDFFTGKSFIKKLKPDVVFSMQNIITFGLNVPQVVYVHQPLPFQNIKSFSIFKSYERKMAIKQFLVGGIIKASIKRANKIIVQTDWMKEAVCEICNIEKDRVVKILPNVKNLSQYIDKGSYDSKKFFYPTSEVIYKNNKLLLETGKLLNKDNVKFEVDLTIDSGETVDGVNYIGRIPYEEVINKYNTATLVFPSYIETFGYPLAEARQMGAIVLAADTKFARELLAGYENAYYFNYDDSNALALLMKQVVCEEIKRKTDNISTFDDKDSWIDVIKEVTKL